MTQFSDMQTNYITFIECVLSGFCIDILSLDIKNYNKN